MPTALPMPTKAAGNTLASTDWNSYVRDNLNKLLNTGHRVLTVAQFGALTGLEGTKGTVAPDEVYLEVDSTNGIQWHLAYESGETTYKWRFLGGPPMYSEVATSETTTSGTYAALATAGPAITLPRAGDFDVEIGCTVTESSVNSQEVFMSYDIGGTGAVDADAIELIAPLGQSGNGASIHRLRRKTALTAVALTAKYRATGGATGTWWKRWMAVRPVRVI